MTTQEVKQEMEEQIKEMAALCKTFSDSIQIIQYKEEKLQSDVATALTNCNNKIEEMNKKIDTQSSAQKILPPSFSGNIHASNEQKSNSKFSEALKTVSSPSFQYHGNPKNWPVHKKKLLNLIWALSLSKIEAIKAIKMSFAGPAVFIAENIDAEELINQMNGNDNGYEGYLKALENLFVGKAESELSRTKFSSAVQERGESIPLFASKLSALFNTAFPNELNSNKSILVIDKFVNGLRDEEQKKFVLQQKEKDDTLDKLIDLALKFEAVNSIMRPNKPSFNYGSNNINMINKQFGRRSDFKPRFQFNSRRFNPYPRQPRPMYTTNPRPFSQNNNGTFAPRRNNYYQNSYFRRSNNARVEDRNNFSRNQNNNDQYWTNNNSNNFNHNPRGNNRSNQRQSTWRGSRSNSRRPMARRNNNRSAIHQIDSNVNEESQD